MKNILLLLGALVLVAVVIVAIQTTDDGEKEPEQMACTMEALLCPDGSAVGRTGPECTFTACPHMDSLTGDLEQTDQGFRLLLGTLPGAAAQEITNVVPLEIQVSNSLQDFINTRVTVFGTFVEGNTYQVESLETAGEGGDSTRASIKVGETKYINGVMVTFNEMVQDVRCAVDADCDEGGAVVVNMTLKSNTDSETTNIASDEVPYAFDAYRIAIEHVLPQRVTGPPPLPHEYVISLHVAKNDEPVDQE